VSRTAPEPAGGNPGHRAAVPTELTIGEVAAIVGVQPHTLRAWERRYRIVLPARSGANQRRYTIEEVRLLNEVKEAVGGRGRSVRRVAERERAARRDAAPVGAAEGQGAGSVWRTAMDLVPAMVLLVDQAGRVLDANAAATRELGLARDQLAHRRFEELAVPGQRSRAAGLCDVPPRQRRDWQVELGAERSPLTRWFDCWPVRAVTGQQLLVLVGHREPAASRPTATTSEPAPAPAGRHSKM
jgi:DNA-binding transcriptional MerR regulator